MVLKPIIQVKKVQLVSVLGIKGSGHTNAIEAISSDGNNEYHCILKTYSNLSFSTHTCAKELIASLLGLSFGLRVPEPLIVEITVDDQELTDDLRIKQRFQNSLGMNFGCEQVHQGALIANYVPKKFIQEAFDIFAFDALVQNDDRRISNPNMFQDDRGFIIFDHEMAFPYSTPRNLLGGFPFPWEFRDPRFLNLKNHFCYNSIKSADIDFAPFIENLRLLNSIIPDIINAQLPDTWKTPENQELYRYLQVAADNVNLFERSLREILA